MKKKKTPANPTPKPQKPPQSFMWNGKMYFQGDTLIVCFPTVGMLQEAKIRTFYEYCSGSFTQISLCFTDWCSMALTVENEMAYRTRAPKMTMKWWQSNWYRGEDDSICLTRFTNNPYYRKGCPKELWNVPMQLDGYVLRPCESWAYLEPPVLPAVPKPIAVEEPQPVGSQLTLFTL